jgi:integrase
MPKKLHSFDPAEARALAPRDWLTFEGMPGLRLTRPALRDIRAWTYRFRSPVDDALRQIRLGHWPAVGWPQAQVKWNEARAKRAEGEDPRLAKKAARDAAVAELKARRAERKRQRVTVAVVVERFLAEHIAVECRTEKARRDARSMLEGRVVPLLGDTPAQDIRRADAEAFLLKVRADAPALARLLRSRLGGAWDHAISTKLLPEEHPNPWRGALKKKLKPKARTRVLDDAELAALLPHLRDRSDETDALLLSLLTAARSGEVVAIDPTSVDLDRGTWTLHVAERDRDDDDDEDEVVNKTETQRTVRLPRQAIEILRRRGCTFQRLPQSRLSVFVREQLSFGLRRWKPHDLRRSARTGLARLGVRDEVCEAALGHVEGGVRGVYNLHRFEREVGEALQLWADHLDALTAPKVVPMRQKK